MNQQDPNILVDLTTCASAFEAEVIRDALDQSGIPAFARTIVGMTNPWDIASTMPYRVQVRRADFEAAHLELTTIRESAVTIDWSAQDLGEPEPGEIAAFERADPSWKEHRAQREFNAKSAILLTSMVCWGRVAVVALGLGGLLRFHEARKNYGPGHCRYCGYSQTGLIGPICPECGAAIAPPTTPTRPIPH